MWYLHFPVRFGHKPGSNNCLGRDAGIQGFLQFPVYYLL